MNPVQPSFGVGDFVLVAFPFTNLSGTKVRPALVLADSGPVDVVLAFVTSVLPGAAPTDVIISSADAEFALTGLRFDSRIRVDRLATLERVRVLRRLGAAGPRTLAAVRQGLRQVFAL